jgi:hypothetical protein
MQRAAQTFPKKQFNQNAGKSHNETLEIVNPVKGTRVTTESVDVHVPENGGTCH